MTPTLAQIKAYLDTAKGPHSQTVDLRKINGWLTALLEEVERLERQLQRLEERDLRLLTGPLEDIIVEHGGAVGLEDPVKWLKEKCEATIKQLNAVDRITDRVTKECLQQKAARKPLEQKLAQAEAHGHERAGECLRLHAALIQAENVCRELDKIRHRGATFDSYEELGQALLDWLGGKQ